MSWPRGILLAPVIAALTLWAGAALWLDGPASRIAAGALVAGFAVAAAGTLLRVRPPRRGLVGFGILFLGILGWWLSLVPSNDRDWDPAVSRLPTAVIDGDRITLQNVRSFDYASENEYTEHWVERSYDLSKLEGVDLFLSYWGSPWIAHTIVSWEFTGGQHLAISIETRKERQESYSALRGFFRQFELYYVVADERDVIRLRTSQRGEDVYLYRLATPPETARAILLDYLGQINALAVQPRWYNAFSQNCTTTIRNHVQHVAPGNPWDWRILVNGRIDELGYERGRINRSLPFAKLRRLSAISERGSAADPDDFSARIRAGLPARPPFPRLP